MEPQQLSGALSVIEVEISANLPPELIIDVLLRLPAKSVGKFRCVSKPWRCLLSTPHFIRAHLTRHSHRQKLVLLSPSGALHAAVVTATNHLKTDVSHKLNFEQLPDNWVNLVGSCDGLVLAVNEEDTKFLINPLTSEYREIRDSNLALDPHASFSMCGFGKDCSTDDYKIVVLSYYDTDNEHEPDVTDTFVDLYSLKTGVWRRLDSSPLDHAVGHIASGAFVNGSLHWLASKTSNYESVIAAFDLGEERFKEVPAPRTLDKDKFVFNYLHALGDCLCMVDNPRDRYDVWVMKDYGVQDSWTKLASVSDDKICEWLKPLCFMGDDQVVLVVDGERLFLNDVKKGCSKDLFLDGVPAMFLDGCTFVESLVSPNFEQHNGRPSDHLKQD